MSERKQISISDIIELIGGVTPKTNRADYWNGDIPWLSVVDFNTGRKYVFETEKKISQLGLKNSSTKLLNMGDLIISARGTVGIVAVLGKPMAFNQSCYGIRANDLSTNDFVYYLLKDRVSNFHQVSHGGVFDTITRDTFREISISLPPLEEQKAIASILSSLDDKIDLLHRQNKTLEAMAETLFRQWFVEEAKEDWEEITLYDTIELIGGGTPKTSINTYWKGDIKWLAGGDIAANHKSILISSEKCISKEGLNNSSAKLLPKFSTVISARGTVGKYCIISEPMAFSQSNYGIKPKYKDCYFFTYLLINNAVEELQLAAYGSVFDTITTNTFKSHFVSLPNEETILNFEKQVETYFLKILNNQNQIQTLTSLREIVLPKLMNGEVHVEK